MRHAPLLLLVLALAAIAAVALAAPAAELVHHVAAALNGIDFTANP